ncbi:MAG: hypothetical protein QXO15_01055 [Nitrososphaerota archaeon]
MRERVYRFLDKNSSEAILFPLTRIYTLFARSKLMIDLYKQVANEIVGEIP